MKPIHFILLGLFSFMLITCKKDKEDEPVLESHYMGSLYFEYSRGFPAFSEKVRMDVDASKTGVVTFSGGGSKNFDATGIKYDDDGDPALKLQMVGTISLNSASGRAEVIDKKEYLFVMVDSRIQGTMYIWVWDDDKKEWIEPPVGGHEFPFDFQDSYSDGEMQFSIVDAVLNESAIKVSLPDVEGTFTYGYTLTMSVALV
jgi:hypothetical protein